MTHQMSAERAGHAFRRRIETGALLPLIGIYDIFSARLAAERFEGVFCSGFSFAASAYGLPDIGYVTWHDMLDFSTKVRHVIPDTHVLVDIDDGFGDEVVAANVVGNLERNGLSAVMMEDQKRPRKCGHFEGKEVLPVGEYLIKLKNVLAARESIFVIARTDATDPKEGLRRAVQYAEAGADGIMVEAIHDLSVVRELAREVSCPIMVNQLHGGKSPNWSQPEMADAGVSIAIYSTPCLFAAQHAITKYLDEMVETKGLPPDGTASLDDCNKLLGDK